VKENRMADKQDDPLMDAFYGMTDPDSTSETSDEVETTEEETTEELEETTEEENSGEDTAEDADTDESPEEQEAEEESEETEEDDKDTEEDDQEDKRTVPLEALHAERTKRQEAQKHNTDLQSRVEGYESQLASVKAQLKEYDLDDVIDLKVDDPLSKEAQEAVDEKKANDAAKETDKVISDIKGQVVSMKAEYANLNFENEDQGTALMGMIVSSMVMGSEMEPAVEKSMKALDDIVKKAFVAGRKTRTPIVKPKPKPKPTGRRVAKSTKGEMMKKAVSTGDFGDVLGSFAKDLAGE